MGAKYQGDLPLLVEYHIDIKFVMVYLLGTPPTIKYHVGIYDHSFWIFIFWSNIIENWLVSLGN